MSRNANPVEGKVIRLGFPVVFDSERKYRYTLWRIWPKDETSFVSVRRFREYVQWIGLNPSTADEVVNDATIRRCMQFSKDWGYGGMCMTNLFAIRSRDPKILYEVEDPVGKRNDQWIMRIANEAGIIVACWGNHGTLKRRDDEVRVILPHRLHVLGLTQSGNPLHPLRLSSDLEPVLWNR